MDEMVMGKFSFQAFFRQPELSALKKVTGAFPPRLRWTVAVLRRSSLNLV